MKYFTLSLLISLLLVMPSTAFQINGDDTIKPPRSVKELINEVYGPDVVDHSIYEEDNFFKKPRVKNILDEEGLEVLKKEKYEELTLPEIEDILYKMGLYERKTENYEEITLPFVSTSDPCITKLQEILREKMIKHEKRLMLEYGRYVDKILHYYFFQVEIIQCHKIPTNYDAVLEKVQKKKLEMKWIYGFSRFLIILSEQHKQWLMDRQAPRA